VYCRVRFFANEFRFEQGCGVSFQFASSAVIFFSFYVAIDGLDAMVTSALQAVRRFAAWSKNCSRKEKRHDFRRLSPARWVASLQHCKVTRRFAATQYAEAR
jgi:hypothetical protein